MSILNKSDNIDNIVYSMLNGVKLGIDDSDGELCEDDVKINGTVLLPSKELDRR